jgi:hypothetical protein
MLSTASVASSATILNIDIKPYLDGSQTQISWYFTGDIVSDAGARFGAVDLDGYTIETGLGSPVSGLLNKPIPSTSFAVTNAGFVSNYHLGSSMFTFAVASIALNAPQSLFFPSLNTNYYPILLSFDRSVFVAGELKYTPGEDSYAIPLAFSSFNLGTYSSGIDYSRYKDGLTTVVNVVPEPSTYALFGIGAIGMLMVLCRKKTV